MPINPPFIFAHEDDVQDEINKLDVNQQHVLPVLANKFCRPTLGNKIQNVFNQHIQQLILQLPINSLKATTGQLHQHNLFKAAVADTIWLTVSHQTELVKQNITSTIAQEIHPQIGALLTIIPDLQKDPQTIFNNLIINPLINQAFQIFIEKGWIAFERTGNFIENTKKSFGIFKQILNEKK